MVSIRCKMVVKSELEKLNLKYKSVELGEVELEQAIDDWQRDTLRTALLTYGLVVMDDKRSILVEKIKTLIIEMIHYNDELPDVNYSVYISEKLNYNYTYLANLFAEVKGTTIEHFIILHKIEKVKELIIYDELSLTEIASLMKYSSAAHLSKQFKKITGLTPSYFKQMKNKRRNHHQSPGVKLMRIKKAACQIASPPLREHQSPRPAKDAYKPGNFQNTRLFPVH